MFLRRLVKNVTLIKPNRIQYFFSNQKGKDQSFYNLLKIPTNATLKQIENSYQSIVKEFQKDGKPSNPELLNKIRQAYAILSNPSERQKYDLQRGFRRQDGAQKKQSKQKAKPYTPKFQDVTTAKGNSPFFSSPMINFAAMAGVAALIYFYFYGKGHTPVKSDINMHNTASEQARKSMITDKPQKSILAGDRDSKLK